MGVHAFCQPAGLCNGMPWVAYSFQSNPYKEIIENDQNAYFPPCDESHHTRIATGYGLCYIPGAGGARPETANDTNKPARDGYYCLQRIFSLESIYG